MLQMPPRISIRVKQSTFRENVLCSSYQDGKHEWRGAQFGGYGHEEVGKEGQGKEGRTCFVKNIRSILIWNQNVIESTKNNINKLRQVEEQYLSIPSSASLPQPKLISLSSYFSNLTLLTQAVKDFFVSF